MIERELENCHSLDFELQIQEKLPLKYYVTTKLGNINDDIKSIYTHTCHAALCLGLSDREDTYSIHSPHRGIFETRNTGELCRILPVQQSPNS